MSLSPGSRLGTYEVVALLGAGGMGEVYRALDTRLNRTVAIKVWQRTGGDADEPARRLLREARAASALNHPNIVIIHELGETPDGGAYIVQEFIEGQTLRERMAAPLPLGEIAELGRQVAHALAAAHAVGVVHRDIKPDNIMIRGDGYVKVLDFGIARVAEVSAESAATQTAAGTMNNAWVGTPSYMSPERLSGDEVGPPSDIFALGVVLFELATGQRPFVASTTMGIFTSIATATPVPVTRLAPDIPRSFDDLVQAMLEKLPAQRPSADDVAEALASFVHGAPVDFPTAAIVSRSTVGREAQLAQLHEAYAQVRNGTGAMIGIAGEPGIGKSSLLAAFLGDLSERPERPTFLQGRCSESLAGSEAYLPVLEALDSLRLHGGGGSVDTLMRTVAPTWYVQVATGTQTSGGDGREAIPPASQERMKRELSALLQDLSRRAPLVLFIDDLHWADVSTIDILNYLTGHFDHMRVLVVTCFRPSDMALAKHPFLAIRNDLQSRGHYEEVALSFLGADDVARYLSLQFPGHRFPESFVRDMHARTEGSPLFMVDLVRYLKDTGTIVEVDGVWEVARSLPDTPKELPESVRGMIARKIERVDDLDRRLLLAASVQGGEFDSAILSDVLDMDPEDVEERLETLEVRHVLVQRGDEYEYPNRTLTLKYRFVHILYQNVLYASLQPTRRASLSAKTAKALVDRHGVDTGAIAGRLAILFETARDFASAAQYFSQAAQRAVTLFAFREALGLADRGIAGLRGLPEDAGRLQLELGLQMLRALALRWVKGWVTLELELAFGRAREICQALEDPPETFPVLWNLAFFNMIRGNLREVQSQLTTLRGQATTSGNPVLVVATNHVDGVTSEFMGDVVRSTTLLEEAREKHDPAQHKTYNAMFGIDPGMVARAMSARPLWALGYADRALTRAQETVRISRSQRQPVTLVFALIVEESVRLYRGEWSETIALGEEIAGLCREYAFPQEAEWGRAFQGAALVRVDRVAEGAQQLRESLDALAALRSGLVRTLFLSLLAEGLWRAGEWTEAHTVLDEGFSFAERTLEHGFLHELNRIRGGLLIDDGRPVEAEACLRAAIAHARHHQARAFELRATSALTRFLIDTDRAVEGRALLAPLLEWFSEGLDTIDVITARALLSEIG